MCFNILKNLTITNLIQAVIFLLVLICLIVRFCIIHHLFVWSISFLSIYLISIHCGHSCLATCQFSIDRSNIHASWKFLFSPSSLECACSFSGVDILGGFAFSLGCTFSLGIEFSACINFEQHSLALSATSYVLSFPEMRFLLHHGSWHHNDLKEN